MIILEGKRNQCESYFSILSRVQKFNLIYLKIPLILSYLVSLQTSILLKHHLRVKVLVEKSTEHFT